MKGRLALRDDFDGVGSASFAFSLSRSVKKEDELGITAWLHRGV